LEKQVTLKNIKIIKDKKEDLPPIKVDAGKIKQVFWNLIINATEAMPEGGSLTIRSRLSKSGQFIAIEFTDTGIGISDEQKKKLFDPFFTTKGGGTGLGLAVSYGIIEQHQGKIEVKSRLSQGSSFTVSLPVDET
jgi:two-component system NtrC family sensor kinase